MRSMVSSCSNILVHYHERGQLDVGYYCDMGVDHAGTLLTPP